MSDLFKISQTSIISLWWSACHMSDCNLSCHIKNKYLFYYKFSPNIVFSLRCISFLCNAILWSYLSGQITWCRWCFSELVNIWWHYVDVYLCHFVSDLSECQLVQVPHALYLLLSQTPPQICNFSHNEIKRIPPKLCQNFTQMSGNKHNCFAPIL